MQPNYNKIIDAFLWKFFGTLFLLFVIFKLFNGLVEANAPDELGSQLDALGTQTEQVQQRIEKAVGK